MKTRTKQKQKKDRTTTGPDDGLVEIYRAYPRFNQDDSMRGLASFLAHRAMFQALGDTAMAAATERAWWQDACLLAAEPAGTADQARAKIEALRPALDARGWLITNDGLGPMTAMITAAVERERQRFGLLTPTRH